MTTKKGIAIVFSFLVISFVIVSCSKKTIVSPPTINLQSPAENGEFIIGSDNLLKMTLTSNSKKNLKSYKINIHENFDGHEHKSSLLSAKANSKEKVIYEKSFEIPAGKTTFDVNSNIDIPSTAREGKYHMLIFCTDDAGNEAKLLRNIVLKKAVK